MVFIIAIKDILIISKDKKALLIMLVMPLLIMIILGNSLGFMFEDEFKVNKFKIAIVNKDNGAISDFFMDVLKGEKNFESLVGSDNDASKLMEEDKVKAIVYIPENFTVDIENQKEVRLTIKAPDFDEVELKIVSGLVEGFSERLSTGFAGTKATMESYYRYIEPVDGSGKVMSEPVTNDVMIDLLIEMGSRSINYKNWEYGELRYINGVQYYAATILVMFILFGASFGAGLFVEERELKTMRRILTTWANKKTLIFGKFIGLFIITFIQSVILILFSYFVYKVYWGPSYIGIILVTFSSVFSGSSIGMFIAAVTKTRKAASAISQLIIQVFNILGGGMVPLRVLPDFFQKFGKISLNWWAANSYHNLMMGYSLDKIFPYCLVILGMGVVYLTIGIIRFRID